MASDATRFKILKHLSAGADTFASIVEKVTPEVGSQFFAEQALKQMIDSGEVVRASDGSVPKYQAPGAAEGKYADYNDKRLHQWPKKGGPYDYQPWKEPFGDKEGQ